MLKFFVFDVFNNRVLVFVNDAGYVELPKQGRLIVTLLVSLQQQRFALSPGTVAMGDLCNWICSLS